MQKKARKTRKQLQAQKLAAAKQVVDTANAASDPLQIFEKFHSYTTKDGDMITLSCIKASNANIECKKWIFDLMERNMKTMYEQSDWGWNYEEKQKELTDSLAWYLIAMCDNKFVGFSHFRFDVDYGMEVLYCYELQLEMSVRHKGLGCFMMTALENIAFHNQMRKVVLTVFKHNPSAIQFFRALGLTRSNEIYLDLPGSTDHLRDLRSLGSLPIADHYRSMLLLCYHRYHYVPLYVLLLVTLTCSNPVDPVTQEYPGVPRSAQQCPAGLRSDIQLAG